MIRHLIDNIFYKEIRHSKEIEHRLGMGGGLEEEQEKKRSQVDTIKKEREKTRRREPEKSEKACDTTNKKGKGQWDRLC